MSPLTKALLGAALTLPLVAFVAGALTTPEPVDDDRSRPVIIGRVSDDDASAPDDDGPTPDDGDGVRGGRNGATDDRGAGQGGVGSDGLDDVAPDDQDDGPTDDGDPSPRVVIPPPRNLDDGDDDGDDDDDNADADDSEGGSGGGSGGASGDD